MRIEIGDIVYPKDKNRKAEERYRVIGLNWIDKSSDETWCAYHGVIGYYDALLEALGNYNVPQMRSPAHYLKVFKE